MHWLIALVAVLIYTPAAAQPLVETNPAVRAALELPREQPADYLRTVLWLVDLGRPELARPIMEELIQLPMTDGQRGALVEQFGPRDMLRLARVRELAPAGADFADACMAAAAAAATDPGRIAALVAQLTNPSPEVRQFARADLAATGQPGVVATLEALARESDPTRRAALAAAASQMAPLVVGPLLAMLDTNDPALHSEVANLLDRLQVLQAAPLIAASSASAERALLDAITRHSEGVPPFPLDEANQIELWHWDDASRRLTSARYPVEEARVIWLSRLAHRLAELRPDNGDYVRQALVLRLEAEALAPPVRRAVVDGEEPLAMVDTALLNEVLADALTSNYAHAAAAAADMLAHRGDVGLLLTADAQPAPLADALVHPNRRVRFAALRAIMTLDPPSAYPGASRLPDALTWFAASEGQPQAVVAMPTHAAASNVAGLLIAQGYDAQATNRGREAVDVARGMADLELIFVDMNVIMPDVRQVLFELRSLPTTGRIPIALLAADGRLEAAERLAAEHERVFATPRPHSEEVLTRIVEHLNELAGRDAAPADERATQAEQARAWLAQLAEGHRPYYTIRTSQPPAPRPALPTASP